jgi:hypothetical protein
MDSETVYMVRRRLSVRKQSVRILLVKSDCFMTQAGILTDFNEGEGAWCTHFCIFLFWELVKCADDNDQRSSEFRLFVRFRDIV